MNWDAIKFDWNQAKAFLATVQEGSFSAAALKLKLTQPTLSRQVSALEADLGVTLFERNRRSLQPTETGSALAEHVRLMASAATQLSLEATGRSGAVEGLVTITATSLFAAKHLPAVIAAVREQAPGIIIEVVASNAVQDLRKREADIAVRHARPTEPELIGRLISETPVLLYGANPYFERHGRPRSISELEAHAFVGFDIPERVAEGLAERGLPLPAAGVRAFSQSGEVIVAMVREGLGLAVLTEDVAADAGLEPVLTDQFRIDIPTWLVTHRELRTNRRIRLVYDAIAAQLKAATKNGRP